MRSLKDIKRAVGRAAIHSRPEVDRAILDRLVGELTSSAEETATTAGRHHRKQTVRSNVVRFAAAAGVAIAVLFGIGRLSRKPQPLTPEDMHVSAAEMLTVGRLNTAYRRGDLEGLEQHSEQAAKSLGLAPSEKTAIDQFFMN